MNKVWIVIANARMSTIYSVSPKNHHFNLVKTLFHAEDQHQKNSDLTSDGPGHYQKGRTSLRGSYEETNHKELETERFAQHICQELEHGRTTNAYQSLIVIAEPRFYGHINTHAGRHVQPLIKYHLAKDYTHFSTKKLKEELEKLLAHEIRLLMIS